MSLRSFAEHLAQGIPTRADALRLGRRHLLSLAAGMMLAANACAADPFPNKPVTLIIPYAAGGPTDVLGRVLAEQLSKTLGQRVVVENRTGAGVMIGTVAVARARPDGYTLLLATVAHAVNATLQPKLAYDTRRDFAAIGLAATVPLVVLTHPDVPAHTLQELLAYLKAHPDQATYGSAGVGSAPHIAAELLRLKTGIPMRHVPYRGSAPALNDLMGGQITFYIDSVATGLKYSASGKLRALAITSAKRSGLAPNLPTVAESGVPGYEAYTWNALFAPAGTPPAVVDRLQAALADALADRATRERIGALGGEIPANTSATSLDAFVQTEIVKWGEVVRASGMRPD